MNTEIDEFKILVIISIFTIIINSFFLYQHEINRRKLEEEIATIRHKIFEQGETINEMRDKLSRMESDVVEMTTSTGKLLREINNLLAIPEKERIKLITDVSMSEYKEMVEKWIGYDPELNKYLRESEFIFCSERVEEKAKSMLDLNSFSRTLNNIADWITTNIEYPSNGSDDPFCQRFFTVDEILTIKSGCCLSHAILFCSLSRCLGIPCRVVIGDTEEGLHAWAEVGFFSEDTLGWKPIETVTGSELALLRYLQRYGKKEILDV